MLEGTLDSFTLPDIFQLLAFTTKTGCLHLEKGTDRGRVWFRDGSVHYAIASTGRLALGKRLVGAGVVSAEQLQAALDKQQDLRGMRLGRILVDEGDLAEDVLAEFVREQILDSVFDLMRWPDGSFRFDVEDTDEDIGISVSVENLIMEGSRRLDEWDTVRHKIPNRRAVVALAPSHEGEVHVNLQPEEWRLLALVDGRRTVGDLIEIHGQGEFQTSKLLYGLVGAGLLEIVDPEVHGPPSIAALLAQHELLRQLEASVADVDDEVVARAAKAPPVTEAQEVLGSDDATGDDVPTAEEPVELGEEAELVEAEAAEEPADAETPEAEAAVEELDVPDSPASLEDTPVEAPAEPAAASSSRASRRIVTDPSIDAALLDRLIDGVKAL